MRWVCAGVWVQATSSSRVGGRSPLWTKAEDGKPANFHPGWSKGAVWGGVRSLGVQKYVEIP